MTEHRFAIPPTTLRVEVKHPDVFEAFCKEVDVYRTKWVIVSVSRERSERRKEIEIYVYDRSIGFQ